jgi:cbb3-type cytochrome oxidase subunit 3
MERTASTLVLGLILAAATAWLFGSAVRAVLRFLGESMRYAGDVGGLAALVAFLLLGAYVLFRVVLGTGE